MSLAPEQAEKLLELIRKAHDDSNPNQVSDLKCLGGTIYGTFESLLKKETEKTIKEDKGFLPKSKVWKRLKKNKEDKDNDEFIWCECPTINDDYVDEFVMSFIEKRLIKGKALKNCSNIYMIIGWLKKGIKWHVIDTLRTEGDIFKDERLKKLLNSNKKPPFNAIAKDCNGNIVSDIELNKHLIKEMIIPRQPKIISMYTKGNHDEEDNMIHTDVEVKLSKEYVEKPDEIMEKEETFEIIEKALTKMKESNPLGSEIMTLYFKKEECNYTPRKMAEIINTKFPAQSITKDKITQRLSSRHGSDLYNFTNILLKLLKETASPDEVLTRLRGYNKKKIAENTNGGEE